MDLFIWLLPLLIAIVMLCGCAPKPQVVREAVYIDKPCPRSADQIAPPEWINTRWIGVAIDGIDYAATPDISALLGNLERLKKD